MPYIYSQGWRVAAEAGTMMRALVMDFPDDVKARQCRDEFLFGPAFLVCPVTQKGANSREVYLPSGSSWIDFWTGATYEGGKKIQASAPIQTMPLYVRAGSIVPMGPYLQHVSEKPADPIELRIYRGANGSFCLYEDDGSTNNYKNGDYSTIPIFWNDKAGLLTIGNRSGAFPEMLRKRTFRIVLVSGRRGKGIEISESANHVLAYFGKSISVRIPKESQNDHN
jgi:alpha-D-xyloside xylohydrolase